MQARNIDTPPESRTVKRDAAVLVLSVHKLRDPGASLTTPLSAAMRSGVRPCSFSAFTSAPLRAQPFDHRNIPVAEPHRLPAFGIVVLSQGGLRVLSADQQDALLPLASFKDARREVCKGMCAACSTTRIGPSSPSTEALSSSSGFREPESLAPAQRGAYLLAPNVHVAL